MEKTEIREGRKMKVQVYNTDCYDNWEEAIKNGAVYEQELPADAEVISTISLQLIMGETIYVVEQCLNGGPTVKWRIMP